MDSDAVVSPPHVARPLRLDPFQALALSPSRVADPASARAFTRPYREVTRRLREWEQRGAVVRDTQGPALHVHEYTSGGLTVRGLVGAMDLSSTAPGLAERAVWPHEGVHPAQVRELAARMREMEINPAPILLVHRAEAPLRALVAETAAATPDREFTDRLDHRHRLWAIREPHAIARINHALADARVLLADGHHRYAAYLALQRELPGTGWDRGLAMVVDQDDTPLFLGAIHRLLEGAGLDDVADGARACDLAVEELPRSEALGALSSHRVVATDGTRWATILTPGHELAVETVHRRLLPALPGRPRVRHRHAVDPLLEGVGPRTAGLLLPAPAFDAVQATIRRGDLLPEKATSFQPKPAVGVLMRSLNDE